MLPFKVDPAWYDEFWMTERLERPRSLPGNLARLATVVALLAGGGVTLSHFQAHQSDGYQDWDKLAKDRK